MSSGFVIKTAQGRAVVLEDVSEGELEASLQKAAENALASVRARHGISTPTQSNA